MFRLRRSPDPARDAAAPSAASATTQPPITTGADQRGVPHPPTPPGHRKWGRRARTTPDRPCLNCGDPTIGWYCPTCGQRKADVRISLRRMLMEALDDQLSLNSTLPRTLGALFFRPGHLTREYVQGRIVRYIPPFRLYLVSSLIFFLLLPFVADPGQISMGEETQARADSIRAARMADSVLLAHARATGEDTVTLARSVRSAPRPGQGSIQFGPDPDNVPGFMKPVARRMKATEARLNSMPRNEALRTLLEAFEENAPVGVFVMMPLFALILKMLYVRKKRFYVEHFVYSLHVHAFVFSVGTVLMLAQWEWLRVAVLMWLLLYVYLSLKKVYGQGIIATFFKLCLLGVSYSVLLVFGVTATVLATAISLG
ncbi:MAG TPA: DUF3667 domain-containing protein [Longimicrobium sp.]|nr:DUF3667 domain-containing protein [Longimicrobium sp.]